jgi:hypothetical protein
VIIALGGAVSRWRRIFLVNLFIGAVTIPLAAWRLPGPGTASPAAASSRGDGTGAAGRAERRRTAPVSEIVADVQRQGYAVVDQELEDGLRPVAAPIHGAAYVTARRSEPVDNQQQFGSHVLLHRKSERILV